MIETLYNMDLHETYNIGDSSVALRVPGGWIYASTDNKDGANTSTFVPYDDEFNDEVSTMPVDNDDGASTQPVPEDEASTQPVESGPSANSNSNKNKNK